MWWNKDKKYFRLDVSPDLINFKREEDFKVYPVQKKKGDKISNVEFKINKKIVDGKRAKPDSFIISSNGDWHWYWWCAHNECWATPIVQASGRNRRSGLGMMA
mgnify:CR=1 FL=1